MDLNKLVIGGELDGTHAPWSGDIVELPDNISYRKLKLRLEDAAISVYVISTMTNKEAIERIKTQYLCI